MTRSRLTSDVLRQMANHIYGFLRFTEEASQGGQPIPVLDTEMWVGKVCPEGKWYPDERAPGKEKGQGDQEGGAIILQFLQETNGHKDRDVEEISLDWAKETTACCQ